MASFCGVTFKMISLLLVVNVLVSSAASICTPAEIAQENLKKLAQANNDFGLKLYRKLSDRSSENVFFSPLSLSTAFGMLFYGAKGDTSKELRDVLGYEKADLPSELVHSSFNLFLNDTAPENDKAKSAYTLNLANAVLLAKQLNLVPQYKSEIQRLYHAIVQDVDFTKDSKTIKDDINAWVKAKTNNKIQKLFDSLSPSTIMVLLNAVYFKGTWETQFQKEKTKPGKFYNGGLESEAKEVPMMNVKSRFLYFEDDDMQTLELPYKGKDIRMIIWLPKERDGVSDLEKKLTAEKFAGIQPIVPVESVTVSIPKFKIEYSKEMSPDIQELGAKTIFNAGNADFSGISSDKGVYVSQILHKAVIEVSEEGSEAAAVTGIVTSRSGGIFRNPVFKADHPFLFTIIDKRSRMVLFAGRINKI